MIKVSIYTNAENVITGFLMSGHAGYSESGSDIVCSAVSALVTNTINSIEKFTSDVFHLNQDEKKGLMEFHVISPISNSTNLLLSSLVLGLHGIEAEYSGKYLRLTEKKSQ